MYHHIKKLMYTVNVGTPNARFGRMLLEQFGGANGELAAAMQYTLQGWNCVDDLARRDLLLDIGTEELSHLEVVGREMPGHPTISRSRVNSMLICAAISPLNREPRSSMSACSTTPTIRVRSMLYSSS